MSDGGRQASATELDVYGPHAGNIRPVRLGIEVVLLVVGAVLIWIATLSNEGEENRIKNHVYELWFRLAGINERTQNPHLRLTDAMMNAFDRTIDALYGEDVLSIAGFSVAIALSVASLYLGYATFVVREYSEMVSHGVLASSIKSAATDVLLGLACFVAAFGPRALSRIKEGPGAAGLAIVVVLGGGGAVVWGMYRWIKGTMFFLAFHPIGVVIFALLFGVVENIICVLLLRVAGGYWIRRTKKKRVAIMIPAGIVVSAVILSLVIMLYAPERIIIGHTIDYDWVSTVGLAARISTSTNTIEIAAVILIGAGMVLLVIHAGLWDLCLRLVSKFHVELPKEWLFRIGKLLVGTAVVMFLGKPIVEFVKKGLELPEIPTNAESPVTHAKSQDSTSPRE